MSKDCVQHYDVQPAPCWQALGECENEECLVQLHLQDLEIDYQNPLTIIDYHKRHVALHWICPQSIHNPKLSNDKQQRIISHLTKTINT